MKSLLLLDADIVIHLHELDRWKSVLSRYKVYLPSTILGEIKFYLKNEECISIDLSMELKAEQVVEVSVGLEDQQQIHSQLVLWKLDGVHEGELEALSYVYLHKDEDLQIALKDKAAIKAAVLLGIIDKALSVERMLKAAGVLRAKDKMKREFSEQQFKEMKAVGAMLAVEAEKSCRKKK